MLYSPPGRSSRRCKYWWFDAWDWIANRVIAGAGPATLTPVAGQVAMDLHIHTMFSHCSISRPDRIILHASRLGLGGVAIMDHDETSGAADAIRCAEGLKEKGAIPPGFLVIPGVEVFSKAGHIGALFVQQTFPRKLSPEATVDAIHEAGGLAVAVHPFCQGGIGNAAFDAPFDAIDVESGAILAPALARQNRLMCADPRFANVAKIGSSDAHYIRAIGLCYAMLEMSEPTLQAARQAILDCRTSPGTSRACERLRRLVGTVPRFRRPSRTSAQASVPPG